MKVSVYCLEDERERNGIEISYSKEKRMKILFKKSVMFTLIISLLLHVVVSGCLTLDVHAADDSNQLGETISKILYVDGVGGGKADGSDKNNAFATMAEAFDAVPVDNVKSVIVICGEVTIKEETSGKVTFLNAQKNRFYLPAYNGEVVVTSVWGEESYKETAGIHFDSGTQYLLGDISFENVRILTTAYAIFADYFKIHLGEGITGKAFATNVYLGTGSDVNGATAPKTPITLKDTIFTMESGTIGTVYGGGSSYQGIVAGGKDYSVTMNLSGSATVTTLIGSGKDYIPTTNNAHHKSITINMNGGTVGTLYGAQEYAKVYGDIIINLSNGTIGTVYGACEYTGASYSQGYQPEVTGNVEVVIGDATVTTLAAEKVSTENGHANIKGDKVLHYSNAQNATMASASGFDTLKVTNSSVTIPAGMENLWNEMTQLWMTDDSVLTLATTPTEPTQDVKVSVINPDNIWNTDTALINAPENSEDIFSLVSPVDHTLVYDSTGASWKLKKLESYSVGESTGEMGSELNINLGLPDEDNYTSLSEDATAYETYLAKMEDFKGAGIEKEVNVITPVDIKGEVALYVDVDKGSDNNPGTKTLPFATIAKALEAIEGLQSLETPPKGIVVYLRAGNYVANETITLGSVHSGKNGIPVIISSYNNEKVVITGGVEIPGNGFSKVETIDETVYNKLATAVRDNVVAVDLKQYGITNFGAISGGPQGGPSYQIFINGEELTLARYPNVTKLALTGEVKQMGEITATYSSLGPAGTNSSESLRDIKYVMTDLRPTLWENNNNIWLKGSLYAEWDIRNIRIKSIDKSEEIVTLDGGCALGARTLASNTYYYYNILEELDVPGEYYLDTEKGILYLYPLGDMSDATVTYSAMQGNIFNLEQTANVVLNGLSIENNANYGVYMNGCTQTLVQNCIIRNVGNGVRIHGTKSGVVYSDIEQIANRPVTISEMQTDFDYGKEENFLQNCYIHSTGTKNEKYCDVQLLGTGNVVSHNLMQGAYSVSIYLQYAKECIVEYNEIVGGPTGTYDSGAIYHPYSPVDTGNHIRYNYIHDIALFSEKGNPSAIYFDEGLRGNYVYGNIMANVPSGFLTNSGSENVIINNVVLNGREGTVYAIGSGNNFANYTVEEFMARNKILKTVYDKWLELSDQQQASFKTRYPLQAKLYEDIQRELASNEGETGLFICKDNYVHNNVIYDCKGVSFQGGSQDIDANVVTATDPFTNISNHDFSLNGSVSVEFTYSIPSMDKVGVITDNKQSIDAFAMYAPSDGNQLVNPYQVLLKWSNGGGADTYELKISKNSDMNDARSYIVTQRYHLFENDVFFDYDTPYYWTVTANSTAESRVTDPVAANSGQVFSFKTMTRDEYLASNPLDFTELEATIAEANALLNEIKDISAGGIYADGTTEALSAAIIEAQAVVSRGNEQEQTDVNKAQTTLTNAIWKAEASREIKYVTFEQLDATEWSDIANKRVLANVEGEELKLSIPSGGRAETVYSKGLGIRDILCFQYKLDMKSAWNGFGIAQSNTATFITEGTDGYFICINPGQIELQKYQGGKVVQINKSIDNTIFDGNKYYNIEIGAINNPDGSVGIHFKIDDTLIFDPEVFVDTKEDKVIAGTEQAIPGVPIIDATGFGVIVNPSNGTAYLKKADPEENQGTTDGYTAGLKTMRNEVTVGDTVDVTISVSHSDANETAFAAGEVVVTYDSTKLTFDKESSKAGLGTATVEVSVEDNVGTITLEDFGANKDFANDVYRLTFNAVADGSATVTMTSAAFIDTETSAKDDLIAATISPAFVTLTVNKVAQSVTLPEGFDGDATVTDGETYTFSVADEDGAYYDYGEVTATVNGVPVEVTKNVDGTYTITSVTGTLEISGTRTPKSYDASLTGTAAEEITDAADTATYGVDYTFTMPTANGFAYKLESLTIDGVAYTDYTVDSATNVYTIPGSAIKGQIAINISKTATKAAVTVTGSGAGAATGYEAIAVIGEDYVLTINPENGCTYIVTATMNGASVEVIVDSSNNTYTVKDVTGPIVFTVERVIKVDGVEVTNYLTVNANNVWLIKNATTVAEGKVPTYDGKNMFWSEKYNTYCYLVIAETISADEVTSKVGIADGTATNVDYGMDVNMSGKVDTSDAQLTYNIYNAMYAAFTEDVTVEKFLRADVNYDGEVNTTDAAAIITHILGNN